MQTDKLETHLPGAIRMVIGAVFTLLFGFCTARVAWQGEWVGACIAAAITLGLGAAVVLRWRRLARELGTSDVPGQAGD
jgi:hypothetical protein